MWMPAAAELIAALGARLGGVVDRVRRRKARATARLPGAHKIAPLGLGP